MSSICSKCSDARGKVVRPRDGSIVCHGCFFEAFENEVHETILMDKLFQRGDKVAIGASGGKDSTVLAYLMKLLNERHDYGLELFLLSIDEGIAGYRDHSLETVHRNKVSYALPLTIVSYKELYGWTMDEIVAQIGRRNNCTFCGVFRRQALDRGALLLGCTKVVTGHNADDVAETVLMNLFRGDVNRLGRCADAVTGDEGSAIQRSKPFRLTYQKEIVLYAHLKKLDYFSTECTYAGEAFRGGARALLKDLERIRPRAILDIVRSGEAMTLGKEVKERQKVVGKCSQCGYIASQSLCKACQQLRALNEGKAKISLKIEREEAL